MITSVLRYFGLLEEPISRKYGWKPDKKDERDYQKVFEKLTHKENELYLVDLREKCPLVYDQGDLGSCTANAIAGAYEYDMIKEKETVIFHPSRLFIYYNEREMEGNVDEDAGAEIRDGIKSVNKQGIVPEEEWPYDISKFTYKPDENLYEEAKKHLAVKYERVKQNLEHMKECLHRGYPFVFGFMVYESFESQEVANTGNMPMPNRETESILGGHAVMCVGYNDKTEKFIVRNSWGTEWGDEGYFYMPYEFMLSEDCSDFWTIERVVDETKEEEEGFYFRKLLDKFN